MLATVLFSIVVAMVVPPVSGRGPQSAFVPCGPQQPRSPASWAFVLPPPSMHTMTATNLLAARDAEGMPVLPEDVVKYSTVPKGKSFTATTIPSGLLKDHTTKAGTWGIISVSQGSLKYVIENDTVFTLTPRYHGIIEPTVLHHVAPLSDDVEFVVEFHRLPGTGPVEEKREGLKE